MPKIIDEARGKILESARKHLLEEGYKGLSLRRVAADCSIAVGTIYNYYKNKNTLIAAIMLDDWLKALQEMDVGCENVTEMSDGAEEIYRAIERFSMRYREVWNQFLQAGGSADEVSSRHLMLRGQIEQRVRNVLKQSKREKEMVHAPLLAELILASVSQPDITVEQLKEYFASERK